MTDKDSARSVWRKILANNPLGQQWGKAAEKLRGLQLYRDAVTVFATPGESLYQARINCLVDGKNLVMPAPSIREGFFLLPARTIPFKDFSTAATYKGLHKNGQLLKNESILKLSVGLLLTDSLAVDPEGGRIGEGNGFFDLSCALLHELQGLRQDWNVLTLIQEEQISRDLLPQHTWDINMSGAITPAKIYTFEPPLQKPQIFWEMLSMDQIKRIDPLWKSYNDRLKAED
jgi:5-formyltetrahydrofolate cyclo-ligase